MQPILHLSIPVRDLAEARQFYVAVLGCQAGRRAATDFADVWFYGMQVTLQDRPEEARPAVRGAPAISGSRSIGTSSTR